MIKPFVYALKAIRLFAQDHFVYDQDYNIYIERKRTVGSVELGNMAYPFGFIIRPVLFVQ